MPVSKRTEQLVGGGGGEVELLLQGLPQEGSEAGHHADLHAGCQRDAGEHRVGQQMLGHLGDHYGQGRPGEIGVLQKARLSLRQTLLLYQAGNWYM